ncbi:MAG: AMP-binding protein [Aeromicrobium sp.]|nr:AMP-binding protein [Aeromicrobium sp.]
MYPGVHAATNPDKPALIMAETGAVLTYGELDNRSARLARAFHDLGLRKGDVFAMLSDNRAECLELYWAALRSGLYITAVNHNLSPDEAAYIIDDCDAKILVASAGVGPLAEAVLGSTPLVQRRFAFGGDVDGHDSYEDLIAGAGEPLTEIPRGSDMLYSSGTTGRPKGVKPPLLPIDVDQPGDPLTALTGAHFGINPADIYLSSAPIYHAAPLRWCGVIHAHGGTVVMMDKFSAEGSLEAIEQYAVTVLQMVPTMFVRMLQLPDEIRTKYDISSLRLAIHAAAPCPPEVKQAMIEWWGPILVEYYASTEANGLTFVTSQEWLTKRGSVGRAVLGVAHVCDEDGKELPAGEIGTIYFERDFLPFEYHKDSDKSAETQHPEHPFWTAVGDLGYLDEDGYLFLTDRKAFMIISGGVNIYPQEVENVLALHPAIFDVAVIGVPDLEMGQQVKAVVQLRDEDQASDELAAEIIAYVRERIAHYKTPRSVDFAHTLPRTPTGKLQKGKLEDHYKKMAGASV